MFSGASLGVSVELLESTIVVFGELLFKSLFVLSSLVVVFSFLLLVSTTEGSPVVVSLSIKRLPIEINNNKIAAMLAILAHRGIAFLGSGVGCSSLF